MALITCPDCGQPISSLAPACIACGRPMAAQDSAAQAPSPEPAEKPAPVPAAAPSDAELEASGWVLWRGDKQFGPMSGQDLAGYFKSKMVTATDTVTGPCWPEHVAAIEAAALLQVPAPPPVPAVIADTSRPAPGAMPPRAYVQTTEPAGPSNFLIVLWLLLLFAVQMLAIASNHAVPVKSIPELLTSSFMQYLLIALLCFAIIGLLGKALRGEFPSAAGPLLAMTLVYGLLLAKVFFMPESQSLQTASDVPAEQGKPLNLRDGNAKRDWYGFAIAYEDKRDWQGLLSVATEWTANEPGNVDPWIFKGIACAGLKLYAQAVEADLQASRMAPNNATVWANLASDYLSLGQPPEAEAAARKAVELDSNSAMAWNNLGASLRGEGTQDEAMADFQRAIAIDPSYSTAWGNVGGQYYRRKQYPEALDAYQKALALDPSSQTATVGIANVQEMQRLGGG